MQCTPESAFYPQSCKDQRCYDDCSDSGYSGLFQSPRSVVGVDPPLSPAELNETPKENVRLYLTPKERIKEPVRHLGKDSRGLLRPSVVSWCETPKVYKRDSSLRHRLPMCKPSTDVKDDNQRSPCTNRTESSVSVSFQSRLSESPDSLDMTMEILASNTLKADQDLALSGRKRRLFFTQLRTSTLEDGKTNSGPFFSFVREVSLIDTDSSHNSSASDQPDMKTPDVCKFRPVLSKESSQSPVSSENTDLYDSSSVLCTLSSMHTPEYIRYVLC
ncbi:F-box only protein 43-like [Acanthochromis polyacanthus]|uniref:F-box only protein 43-like n=1 Tax=Acanthochromis polyacanthus TaxID=80966 RepID=UPI0022343EEC|nr:F-box only protein 43-like [Acanthochromis polyacanthus]